MWLDVLGSSPSWPENWAGAWTRDLLMPLLTWIFLWSHERFLALQQQPGPWQGMGISDWGCWWLQDDLTLMSGVRIWGSKAEVYPVVVEQQGLQHDWEVTCSPRADKIIPLQKEHAVSLQTNQLLLGSWVMLSLLRVWGTDVPNSAQNKGFWKLLFAHSVHEQWSLLLPGHLRQGFANRSGLLQPSGLCTAATCSLVIATPPESLLTWVAWSNWPDFVETENDPFCAHCVCRGCCNLSQYLGISQIKEA